MLNEGPVDDVVLLDEDSKPAGTASKAAVHGPQTPLHLAFSCYVTNSRGEVLVTRRALSKSAWPGVWTNSFCGHPRPSETLTHAVSRRADFELGLRIGNVELAVPVFRYRATDASGVVENEVCPVYTASTSDEVRVHPGEVMDHAWVDPADLGRSIRLTPWVFSPWMVLQAQLLQFLGGSSEHTVEAPQRQPEQVRR